jgi:hypothetical protein
MIMRKSVQHFAAAALFLSITTAAPAFCYEKEIDSLSVTMADKIASKGKARVAVVDFADLEGNVRYFVTNSLRSSSLSRWLVLAKVSE